MLWQQLYTHFVDIYDPERRSAVRVALTVALGAAWGVALFS